MHILGLVPISSEAEEHADGTRPGWSSARQWHRRIGLTATSTCTITIPGVDTTTILSILRQTRVTNVSE